MTGEEKDLLKEVPDPPERAGQGWEPSPLRSLVPRSTLCPGPKRPTQPDGSLGTALQGHPGRRPGVQPAAGIPPPGLTADRRGWTGLKGWKSSWVSAIPADRGAGPIFRETPSNQGEFHRRQGNAGRRSGTRLQERPALPIDVPQHPDTPQVG